MGVRKISTRPLQSKEQRNKAYGRGWAYAQQIVTRSADDDPAIGAPPYSAIDAKTLLQRAWHDGYMAALRDVRRGEYGPIMEWGKVRDDAKEQGHRDERAASLHWREQFGE